MESTARKLNLIEIFIFGVVALSAMRSVPGMLKQYCSRGQASKLTGERRIDSPTKRCLSRPNNAELSTKSWAVTGSIFQEKTLFTYGTVHHNELNF
jgi:hypothetical protein